jgi:hypothetical protein
MSHPSPTTYPFNTRKKRSVRLRIEAATMRAGIIVLAQLVLCGSARAATEYAVDGLTVGTQVDSGSARYREYKCNPSDQFESFIWCQKSRTQKQRRRSYAVAYSLLRSQDGRISYINRSQEPAFLDSKESELNIERYSRKFGGSPRIMKMPHRTGFPEGVIAVWGRVTLEPLDQQSIRILADGQNPRRGFLIDYLRDFTRSAKEGLPIYRIEGGPGFIWAASLDQKGRGTVRLAAVDLSGLSPSAAPMAAADTPEFSPPPALVAALDVSEFSPPPAPLEVQATASTVQQELSSKLNQTIDKLHADLVISTNKIAQLEKAKSEAKRALEEAEQAKRDAEKAKHEVEQARLAETISSDALITQLKAAAGAKKSQWEIALYGSIGGVLVILASSAISFLINLASSIFGFLINGRTAFSRRAMT